MKYILLILTVLIAFYSQAQHITGSVFENTSQGKQPLPGVNIYWQGTNSGTTTDENGNFKVSRKNGKNLLTFSFVGYSSKTIEVDADHPVEVILVPDLELGEITIVEKDRGTYFSTINPISTQHIGIAELHKAACCNLAESFETNPSVDVNYSDAVTGAKQIKLLGLDGVYSLLQTENIPNLRGLATNLGINYIPGPWMESISVSKGAASVLNGYESVAGQINVEYKKPDSNEKLHLNLFSSDEGKVEFNANTSFRIKSDNITSGFLIHAENLSNRLDHNHDGFLDHPLSGQVNVSNRWKFNDHKGFMAQLGINVLHENRLGGQKEFERGMQRNTSNPYGISIETNRFEVYFKIGYVWPDQRTALAYLTNFAGHGTKSFYGVNDYIADESRFYGNLVFTRDLDKNHLHSINTGLSYVFDSYDEDLYGSGFSRSEKVPGVFAEYTFKPGDNFTVLAGLRADFHNLFGTFYTPRMHLKYRIKDHYTIRLSAGKGYRSANVVAENIYLLAGSRPMQWEKDLIQEKAWNYGIGLVQDYLLFNRDLQVNIEFFRTDFQNQLIIDRETSETHIRLMPLAGKSYSNSFQADVRYQPNERLDLTLAYRRNDVWQTIGGRLMEQPLNSRYKGLISLNYYSNLKKWMFDYTVQFNGSGRIPRYGDVWQKQDAVSPDFYAFSPFTIMNAQITRYFRYWNIYVGSENLTDFRQKHPVQGASDPFGQDFDATNVWGPILGRRVYMGLRFTLNYN